MRKLATLVLFAVVGLTVIVSANAQPTVFVAGLSGYQEVSPISTTGRGLFGAKLSGSMINYSLEYSNLEGGAVRFAHIHFGQLGVNGGVSVFLCDNSGGGPKGTPTCPPSGTVVGTLTADSVVGPGGQGIAAGEFEELVNAMRRRSTYVNLHTDTYGSGEIRGQIVGISGGGGDHDNDDDDDDDRD